MSAESTKIEGKSLITVALMGDILSAKLGALYVTGNYLTEANDGEYLHRTGIMDVHFTDKGRKAYLALESGRFKLVGIGVVPMVEFLDF